MNLTGEYKQTSKGKILPKEHEKFILYRWHRKAELEKKPVQYVMMKEHDKKLRYVSSLFPVSGAEDVYTFDFEKKPYTFKEDLCNITITRD